MPFVEASPSAIVIPPLEESGIDRRGRIEWPAELLYCDPTRQLVDSFRVADVYYRLSSAMHGTFEPGMGERPGRFVVAELASDFVGIGGDLDEAKLDWQLQVDHAIQRLLGLQDFERTLEDRRISSMLTNFFDFNEIRYSQPIKAREMGTIVSAYPRATKVKWIDGQTNNLKRDQIPVEMVGYKVGQPFEAVVERDSRTWQLIRIASAFRCTNLPYVSEKDAINLLGEAPSTKDLPHLDWD